MTKVDFLNTLAARLDAAEQAMRRTGDTHLVEALREVLADAETLHD